MRKARFTEHQIIAVIKSVCPLPPELYRKKLENSNQGCFR